MAEANYQALEAHIARSVENLLREPSVSTPQRGLVLLASWQEAMPALVHLDPVLEPLDTRVYCVLWLWAKQNGSTATAFPHYDYLLKSTNIHARGTLVRALSILRLTRWITLCRRVRDAAGRNRGNVFALHDEPLALSGTMRLDPNFMAFVQGALDDRHARVRQVAQALWQSLHADVAMGQDVLDSDLAEQLNRRLEARESVRRDAQGNYFGFGARSLSNLQAWRRVSQNPPADSVQNLNPDPVQNMNSYICSSRNGNITPTACSRDLKKTTTTPSALTGQGETPPDGPLIFPEALTRNEIHLAQVYLGRVDHALHQPLLDELSEKIRRAAKTVNPVRNPIGLLCWMCNKTLADGPPLTSDSLHARERREREQRQATWLAEQERHATADALQRLGLGSQPVDTGGDSVTTEEPGDKRLGQGKRS